MLTLPPSVQLYVATQPVDARKGLMDSVCTCSLYCAYRCCAAICPFFSTGTAIKYGFFTGTAAATRCGPSGWSGDGLR